MSSRFPKPPLMIQLLILYYGPGLAFNSSESELVVPCFLVRITEN